MPKIQSVNQLPLFKVPKIQSCWKKPIWGPLPKTPSPYTVLQYYRVMHYYRVLHYYTLILAFLIALAVTCHLSLHLPPVINRNGKTAVSVPVFVCSVYRGTRPTVYATHNTEIFTQNYLRRSGDAGLQNRGTRVLQLSRLSWQVWQVWQVLVWLVTCPPFQIYPYHSLSMTIWSDTVLTILLC